MESCEQESLEQIETKTTIIEGYLYDGQQNKLKVTQSYSYGQQEDEIITIDDLNIIIRDADNQYSLSSIGNGYYQNLEFNAKSGNTYFLEFERDGKIISSETYIPERKPSNISTTEIELTKVVSGSFPGGIGGSTADPIEINWDNSEGDYYYVVINNLESEPEYVNENLAQLEANGLSRIVVTEPEIMDFYAINTRRDLPFFGTYQIIIFRVNPEYAALYESTGNTTLSLEQPPTNIVNGLGIFTGVSSDTLYLEAIKK